MQSRYALRFLGPRPKGVGPQSIRLVGAHDGDGGYVLVPVAADHGKPDSLCLFARDTDGGGLGGETTGEVWPAKGASARGAQGMPGSLVVLE